MSLLEAILLGMIQGLTEFLPVSSSGHLELGKALFDYDADANSSMLFSIVVHAATALSTIVVYRKDILELLQGLFKFKWNTETKYVALIALSMIPVLVVGLAFKDEIEVLFGGQILLVGCMLLVTAALLWFTHRAKHREGVVTGPRAIVMGVAQAVAILPGISRSGSTIATALLLGVSREQAARFSFLMVLPPIAGATLLELQEYSEAPAATGGSDLTLLVAAFLAAFVSGLIACSWMVKLVKRSKLSWFAVYCALAGATAIAVGLTS